MFRPFKRRNTKAAEMEAKDARLEQAEKDLGDLEHRAFRAITVLESRSSRNHWRESIERMIQGV